MCFKKKLGSALHELQSHGLKVADYFPWFEHVLQFIGFNVRPVHYRTNTNLFIQQAINFGVAVGLAHYLALKFLFGWELPVPFLPLATVFFGLIYSSVYCTYIEQVRSEYALSQWEDF